MKSLVHPLVALLPLMGAGAIVSLSDPTPADASATAPQEREEGDEQETEGARGDELDDPLMPPLQRYRRDQKLRIEEELVGNWILMDFKDPNNPLAEEYVDGWAAFHDGYMTMFLQMRTLERAIFNDKEQRYFQYGAHRYRVSEDLYLQTSAIMASTNINEDRDILYEQSGFAREFQVDLREDLLELTNRELITFEFRRVDDTKFPIESIQNLQQSR